MVSGGHSYSVLCQYERQMITIFLFRSSWFKSSAPPKSSLPKERSQNIFIIYISHENPKITKQNTKTQTLRNRRCTVYDIPFTTHQNERKEKDRDKMPVHKERTNEQEGKKKRSSVPLHASLYIECV